MANNLIAETVEMSKNDSNSTKLGELAMVFTDDSQNRRGIPWSQISVKEFTLENAMAVACLDGYTHFNPAIYCGVDDNQNALYTIFKQAP